MSHYSRINTQFRDAEELAACLKELYGDVEVHAEAKQLYGYEGDARPEKAHVIVRRLHIGGLSNDLGFVKTEDGTYEMLVSEYDARQSGLNSSWQAQLTQNYAIRVVKKQAARSRFSVLKEKRNMDGSRTLLLRRSR